MKRLIFFCLLGVCLLIQSGLAGAHSVHVFAYGENGMIKGEGSLGGDKKVKSGEIQVFRKSDNKLLLTTRTDANGLFSFPIAQLNQKEPVDLLIVVNAGPGHRSEWNLDVDQYVPQATPPDSADPQNNSMTSRPEQSSPSLLKIFAGVVCIIGLGAIIARFRAKKGVQR